MRKSHCKPELAIHITKCAPISIELVTFELVEVYADQREADENYNEMPAICPHI